MVALKVEAHELLVAAVVSPVDVAVHGATFGAAADGSVVVGDAHAERRLVQHVRVDEEARVAVDAVVGTRVGEARGHRRRRTRLQGGGADGVRRVQTGRIWEVQRACGGDGAEGGRRGCEGVERVRLTSWREFVKPRERLS